MVIPERAKARATKCGKYWECYGRRYPMTTTPLSIELAAYSQGLGEKEGFVTPLFHFKRAFELFYPKFKMHKWVEMEIEAYVNYKIINVIGHTRASKTFTFAHIVYMDYCANPFETWVSLSTVTFNGLRDRMWNDLMTAINAARFPCPFRITTNTGQLTVRNHFDKGLTKEENFSRDRYQIEGFATSKTKDSATRIIGKHAPRRIVVLDEAQGLPDAIWDAEKNAQSAQYGKFVRLANPEDWFSRFGAECTPKDGIQSISHMDLAWLTKSDSENCPSICLHLDGFQCHNMDVYHAYKRGEYTDEEYKAKLLPFQPTPEYFLSLDPDSLPYWKYGKGYFPPDGLINKVFSDSFLAMSCSPLEQFIYGGTKFACMDPAFEHDDCVLQVFEYGRTHTGKWHVNCLQTHLIIPSNGGVGGTKPKDYQIAERAIQILKSEGIKPEDFIMDMSGNGRGVYAIICVELKSSDPVGVEFGGKATDRLLRDGDPELCNKKYAYFVDELWFRASEWMRYGDVSGLQNLKDDTKTDLSSRLYTQKSRDNHLLRVESKKDMKNRIGKSPDYGDAFCLFAEYLARKGIYCGLRDGDGNIAKTNTQTAVERAKKVNEIYGDEYDVFI